jgi:hypothetical protein
MTGNFTRWDEKAGLQDLVAGPCLGGSEGAISYEGIGNFRPGRASRPRLRETGLRE